jgi:hypothetical protein
MVRMLLAIFQQLRLRLGSIANVMLIAISTLLILSIARTPEGGGWLIIKLLFLFSSGLLLGTTILYAANRISHSDRPSSSPGESLDPISLTLMAGLILYMSSSAVLDPWFFPSNWLSQDSFWSKPLAHRAVRSLLIAIPLALLLPWLNNAQRWKFIWTASALWLLFQFYRATGFEMIYRIDSPAFVYRFWSFRETFPHPGFYDPHWNAGMPVPYLVASGIWSMGVFLLPFLHYFPPDTLYSPVLAFAYLFLLPLLAWLSLKWVGAGKLSRWIAALLVLSATQRFWVHLLHYGTVTSLFSMTMTLPLSALWYRYLHHEAAPRKTTLALMLLFALIMFSWPGSLILAVPLALTTLVNFRTLFPRKWKWALGLAACLFILLLPLALVPLRYSNIAAFTETTITLSFREHFANGLELIAHNFRSTNALIVIFGFIGCWFVGSPSMRMFFAPLVWMLLLISGWGEEFKELLQSERIIIPAALVAVIPASLALERIWQQSIGLRPAHGWANTLFRLSAAWTMAIMFLGIYQAGKIWGNQGLATFQTRPAYMDDLITWIRQEVPADGRVMFAGRAVHAYGGAKVAALPLFTEREMMSSDFYGFSPKLVEHNYPPRIFRQQGADGLFEFNELYNVTHILTWHDFWKDTYQREPDRYRRVKDFGRIAIFEVIRPSSLFLMGQGTIQSTFNTFEISLSSEPSPIVIKYHWADGLQAYPSDVDIFPYDAGYDVSLIGIQPRTNRWVLLRYRR